MRNCQVAAAWAAGRTASTQHMTTDGDRLWSYNLVIGFTEDDGSKVAIDYTAPHFVSMTTSCHVGLAKRVADWAEPPRKDR